MATGKELYFRLPKMRVYYLFPYNIHFIQSRPPLPLHNFTIIAIFRTGKAEQINSGL
ncbi:MAG: hypothetical protein IEMM0006_1704 [bacterium]|nr:MAG: hypothetical protein IEMM0006_1704 [bacterium]